MWNATNSAAGTFRARVFYLSTVASPETRMFECKAEIETANLDVELRPGYTARIRAPIRSNTRACVIPEDRPGLEAARFMTICFDCTPEMKRQAPGVVHVDGTARIQSVDRAEEPLVARMLDCFERRTGLPVLVNTSLNTAGRPMVDDPRDALECFGSAPIDLLAIGPFVVRRSRSTLFPTRN